MAAKNDLLPKVILGTKAMVYHIDAQHLCIYSFFICCCNRFIHLSQLVNNVGCLHFCCSSVKHVELFIAFPKITVHGYISTQ